MQATAQSLLTGLTPNFILVGIGCLLLLAAAFLLGIASRSSELWYDRLATWRIRRFAHYRVGDRVTLGANIQGAVTKITPFSTVLIKLDQTQVILSNSLVLRHPIYVHPAPPTLNPPEARQTDTMDGDMIRIPPEAAFTAPSAGEDARTTADGAQFGAWAVAEPGVLYERSFDRQQTTEPDGFTALTFSDQPAPTESSTTLAQPLPATTSVGLFTNEAAVADGPAAPPVQLNPTTSLADLPIAQSIQNVGEPEGADDLPPFHQLTVAPVPVHRLTRLQQRPPLGKCTVKRFKRQQMHYLDQRLPGE